MSKSPPPMLSLQKFMRLKPDEIGWYHGYNDFMDFIMNSDVDGEFQLSYNDYRNWYCRKYTDLGKALNE